MHGGGVPGCAWNLAESNHFPPESQRSLGRVDRVRSGWDLDREGKYEDRGREDSLVREPRCEWKMVRGPVLLVGMIYAGECGDICFMALDFRKRQSRNASCLPDHPSHPPAQSICVSSLFWAPEPGFALPQILWTRRKFWSCSVQGHTLLYTFGSEIWTGLCLNTSDSQAPRKVVLNCSFRVHLE